MSTIFDQVFLFCTFLGNYSIIWILLAVILAFGNKKNASRILSLSAVAIASSFILTEMLKLTLRFPRPLIHSPYCPADYSFPSGHTATSFAAAFMLAQLDRKRAWLYMILAGLISYSRLYLGCHRPIDIAGGLIVAAVAYAISLRFTKKNRSTLAKQHKTH